MADQATTTYAKQDALDLILALDPALTGPLGRALLLALGATALAVALGTPLGAALALGRFPGRGFLDILVAAAAGAPALAAGLCLWLIFRPGGPGAGLAPAGEALPLLLAQALLALPIVAARARRAARLGWLDYGDLLRACHAGPLFALATLASEARPALLAAAFAGFARASGEMGAAMTLAGFAAPTAPAAALRALTFGNAALALALGLCVCLIAMTAQGAAAALDRMGREAEVGADRAGAEARHGL